MTHFPFRFLFAPRQSGRGAFEISPDARMLLMAIEPDVQTQLDRFDTVSTAISARIAAATADAQATATTAQEQAAALQTQLDAANQTIATDQANHADEVAALTAKLDALTQAVAPAA